MEKIKLITREELNSFLKTQEHIEELIELKTIELAKILHDREPIGEICEIDIEESPFESGCIFVEFEEYSCGESCRDQYNLPFEFLYNDTYPVHYKYLHGEKQRKLNEQIEMMRQEDKERKERENQEYWKKQYERLKKIYGDD
jgi:hypothetical protein